MRGKEEKELQDDVSGPAEPFLCYEFNPVLTVNMDDGACGHCRKFMTMECDYIDDFVYEDDWDEE